MSNPVGMGDPPSLCGKTLTPPPALSQIENILATVTVDLGWKKGKLDCTLGISKYNTFETVNLHF